MRHLQQAYDEFREKGLMVLGLNCSDDVEIALEFLKENDATFPNVFDDSEAARRTCYTDYQTLPGWCAVPLSYIIDQKGKIAAGWYGQHDAKKVRKILAGLGLK